MSRITGFVSILLVLAACNQPNTVVTSTTSTTTQPTSTTGQDTGFPVTVTVGGVDITLDERPTSIVSLSPTATETLFAIGAGDQVVAVDEISDYPAEAPTTDLSGLTPNIEAIAEFDPDLIVVGFDPDSIITESFSALGVPVVVQAPAVDRDGVLAQIEQLGALTGHLDAAVAITADMAARWDEANKVDAAGTRVYIEIDSTLYSASSSSFMGSVLVPMGFVNIADEADVDGWGFPQLSDEWVVSSDPQLIILGSDSGVTADDIAARPGWDVISAVVNSNIVVIDSDLSSRWGPRFIEYVERMAELANSLASAP
ncbi:MAG: ABC transporter substrate-binding protein [Acidimicrobiia bacterium]|nr:ABC transporter substrate-binding protein [Acidimicrobiia bacterium]